MNPQRGDPRETVRGNKEAIGGAAISRRIWALARLVSARTKREHDAPARGDDPYAVMLPPRFADGFGTTRGSMPSTYWLAEGREPSPSAWPAAAVSADLEVPPLVWMHAACVTGDGRGNDRSTAGHSGAHTLGLLCDDVLDAVA